MKKIVLVLICIALIFTFVGCGGHEAPTAPSEESDIPPALSLLKKNFSFNKRAPKDKTTDFSKPELETALGSELSFITVTSLPDATVGTLMFKGAPVMEGQTLPADGLGYLKFVPAGAAVGSTAFCFECDAAGYEEYSISCNLLISENKNLSPVVSNATLTTVAGIPCEKELSVYDPDGDRCSLKIITYPSDGYVSVSQEGKVVYIPKEGFVGKDTMVFSAVDGFGGRSENAKLTISVEQNTLGSGFSDLLGVSGHIDAIRMCQNSVMVYKYCDGQYLFEPEKAVSKMDFLVMLLCASGRENEVMAVADTVAEDDEALSAGFKGYLAYALSKGVVRLDSGKFQPKKSITASEAAYMVSHLLSLPVSGDREVFGQQTVPDWAVEPLCAVTAVGIMEKTVSVDKELTKLEVASILCRVTDYMEENGMRAD